MKAILISCLLLTHSISTDLKVETYQNFSERVIENTSSDTIYFINFWATWCRPCVKELPYIEETNGKTIDGKPIKTIMVSLDFPESAENKVRPFLAARNYTSQQVLLEDGTSNHWIEDVDSTWSGAIPATLIIKNNQRYFHEGSYSSYNQIEKSIKKIE